MRWFCGRKCEKEQKLTAVRGAVDCVIVPALASLLQVAQCIAILADADMDKKSPLHWKARPKVDDTNYTYSRPVSAVVVHNRTKDYSRVGGRAYPHTNCQAFPIAKPLEDYSWIRSAPPVARRLPPEHPLYNIEKELKDPKPKKKRTDGDESPQGDKLSKASSFSKDNPNNAKFNAFGAKAAAKGKFGMKDGGGFGAVEKFTAHKAGGHFSSKDKSLLEITRAAEIDLQKARDVAEAKARILLSGGSLAELPATPRRGSEASTPASLPLYSPPKPADEVLI